jgi:hypothetical protein
MAEQRVIKFNELHSHSNELIFHANFYNMFNIIVRCVALRCRVRQRGRKIHLNSINRRQFRAQLNSVLPLHYYYLFCFSFMTHSPRMECLQHVCLSLSLNNSTIHKLSINQKPPRIGFCRLSLSLSLSLSLL